MKCQLSLAQKIRSIEEKLIVLDRFEIHKKNEFWRKNHKYFKKLASRKKRSKKWTFFKKYLQSVKKLKMALKYRKKNLKLDLKSPWRILYNGSNFKLSKYDPELKCAFFSKNWWFSVKKLRLSTIEIWKKAHLRTVHDEKFSSWEIYYIYVRECAFMNLSEKTCFRLLNAPFFIPHENWKNQEFVKWAWISKDKYWNCWKKGAFKL